MDISQTSVVSVMRFTVDLTRLDHFAWQVIITDDSNAAFVSHVNKVEANEALREAFLNYELHHAARPVPPAS